MTSVIKAAAVAALALAGLLLWQRYGIAVALSDGAWFCLTG